MIIWRHQNSTEETLFEAINTFNQINLQARDKIKSFKTELYSMKKLSE